LKGKILALGIKHDGIYQKIQFFDESESRIPCNSKLQLCKKISQFPFDRMPEDPSMLISTFISLQNDIGYE